MVFINKEIIMYRSGVRKTNSAAATQYMISKFNLDKIIVIGTCAGINDKYNNLDIAISNKAVKYDCTVREVEPLIGVGCTVDIDLTDLNFEYNTGTVGTADKAVIMWKDYLELKNNDICITDMESGFIAYVCKMNNVKCLIIRGISDFPISEEYSNEVRLNEVQIETYAENTPLVMNDILENYISKII